MSALYPTGDPEAKVTTRVLRERLGEAVLEATDFRGDLALVLDRSKIIEALELLRDDEALAYDLLLDVCGVDWLGKRETRFDVVYHLKSIGKGHHVRLKVAVPEDEASLPTAVGVFPAADWFEREAWDLYGIRFEGHPYLRRILTHDEFEGHALRKDYPQERRHECTVVSDLPDAE